MKYEGLTRTLFAITNKNDESRYYERLEYNLADAQMLEDRAAHIIASEQPPPRISSTPDWHECSWCDAKEVCFKMITHERTCRTCKNVIIATEGKWLCAIHDKELTVDEQHAACSEYNSIHVA